MFSGAFPFKIVNVVCQVESVPIRAKLNLRHAIDSVARYVDSAYGDESSVDIQKLLVREPFRCKRKNRKRSCMLKSSRWVDGRDHAETRLSRPEPISSVRIDGSDQRPEASIRLVSWLFCCSTCSAAPPPSEQPRFCGQRVPPNEAARSSSNRLHLST